MNADEHTGHTTHPSRSGAGHQDAPAGPAGDHAQHAPTAAADPGGGHHGGHGGHGGGGHPGGGQHGAEQAHAQHGNAGHGHHIGQFRDRFWVSLVLAVPVVVFNHMFADLLGYTPPTFPGSEWVSPVLGTVVFFYGGWPFLTGALVEARSRRPGMMLLIALAITVAFVASWATTLGAAMELDFWWELALLVVIMLLGHWLEMRALGAASGALDALAALLPDRAEKVTGTGTLEVAVSDLATDDVVLVRPGARVPVDGLIVDGEAHLDESMITGESRAVRRAGGRHGRGRDRLDRQHPAGAGNRGRAGHGPGRHPAAGRRRPGVELTRAGAGRSRRGVLVLLRPGRRRADFRGLDGVR